MFLLKALAGGVIKTLGVSPKANGNGVDWHLNMEKAPCDSRKTWSSTTPQPLQATADPMTHLHHCCMTQQSHLDEFILPCHNLNDWQTWLNLSRMTAQLWWPLTSVAIVWATCVSTSCWNMTPQQQQELRLSHRMHSASTLRGQSLFKKN